MPKNARSSHAATVRRNTRLVNLRTAACARIANEDAAARTARLVDLREREATRIANEDAATRSARLADLREREATRIASEDAATRTARLADLREREATRIAHEDAATKTTRLADQRLGTKYHRKLKPLKSHSTPKRKSRQQLFVVLELNSPMHYRGLTINNKNCKSTTKYNTGRRMACRSTHLLTFKLIVSNAAWRGSRPVALSNTLAWRIPPHVLSFIVFLLPTKHLAASA